MKRNKIVAGNWKMNLDFEEAQTLIEDLETLLDEKQPSCEVIICPPFPYLELATDEASEHELFEVGAQNCAAWESGAYTGEVSAKMLDSIGVSCCIIGHSERRKYFGEDNATLAAKVN